MDYEKYLKLAKEIRLTLKWIFSIKGSQRYNILNFFKN